MRTVDKAIQLAGGVHPGMQCLIVGACQGEGISYLQGLGIKVTGVEAEQYLAERAKEQHKGATLIIAAVSDKVCERWWYSTSYAACGSLHEPNADLLRLIPDLTVKSVTPVKCVDLDTITTGLGPFNIILIDVQGHDYEVLLGGPWCISRAKVVVCEVWHKPLYHGTKLLPEIRALMLQRGFQLVEVIPGDRPEFWGDAIFLRR